VGAQRVMPIGYAPPGAQRRADRLRDEGTCGSPTQTHASRAARRDAGNPAWSRTQRSHSRAKGASTRSRRRPRRARAPRAVAHPTWSPDERVSPSTRRKDRSVRWYGATHASSLTETTRRYAPNGGSPSSDGQIVVAGQVVARGGSTNVGTRRTTARLRPRQRDLRRRHLVHKGQQPHWRPASGAGSSRLRPACPGRLTIAVVPAGATRITSLVDNIGMGRRG